MPFEQARTSELYLLGGPYAWGKIPNVSEFGYTHESDVTRRGQGSFGANGPRGIVEQYNGISGTFSEDGPEGEDAINAIITMQDPAAFITGDMSNRFPVYIVANAFEEGGVTPIRSHFVEYAKLSNAPKAVAGSNAMQFSFQAKFARDFAKKQIMVKEFIGNSSPVTALSFSTDTAYAFDGTNFTMLLLRQSTATKSVKVLKLTTDYSETNGAITLVSGLVATEKALAVWVKN